MLGTPPWGILAAVNRLFRILLLTLLLGSALEQVLCSAPVVCAEERQDCCEPGGPCDVDCMDCACCAATAITFPGAASVECLDSPPEPAVAVHATLPPLAPPTDILHVPKSV
jgi:hypothetical protein